VLSLPGGNEDNDLFVEHDPRRGCYRSCWEPTPAERAAIAAGANIELAVIAPQGGHPPVSLAVVHYPLGAAPRLG
jgi:hypothetical protein